MRGARPQQLGRDAFRVEGPDDPVAQLGGRALPAERFRIDHHTVEVVRAAAVFRNLGRLEARELANLRQDSGVLRRDFDESG